MDRNSNSNNSSLKRRNFFQQEENSLSVLIQAAKKRIFTANHLMIQAFHLHPIIFFGILIVEYLQMVFFAFFDMKIVNNFVESGAGAHHLRILSSSAGSSSSTEETQFVDTRTYLSWDSQFNILKLLNYQLMIINQQKGGSSQQVTPLTYFQICLYLHLSVFVFLFIALLFLGRKTVMRAEAFHQKHGSNSKRDKQDQQKFDNSNNQGQIQQDGSQSSPQQRGDKNKYVHAPWLDVILAILVFVAQSLLVIPTFVLFSTVINCDKLSILATYQIDPQANTNNGTVSNEVTYVSDFQCLSRDHIIMIAISSFLAVISLGFLSIEALIYQDLNMKSTLPWRQIPSRVHYLKLLHKLICTLFNFDLLIEKPIALGVFTFFELIIMFKRFQYTRIYWRTFRNWVLFTEFSIFWFSFWNFIQKTTNFSITIYTFSVLIIGGLFPYYLVMLYFFTQWKFERLLIQERHSLKELGSDVQTETYFGYLIDLIKASQSQDSERIILYGLMRVHWYQCKKKRVGQECLCNTLVQRIDKIEKLIDDEHMSRNDQIDVIKIQNQINQLEDDLMKQEEEEIKKIQKTQNFAKMSLNIDHLIDQFKANEQASQKSQNFGSQFLSPYGSSLTAQRQGHQDGSHMGNDNSVEEVHLHPPNNQQSQKYLAGQDRSKSAINMAAAVKQELQLQLQDDILHKNNGQQYYLRKQIKLLLYRFVYNLIEDAVTAYPFSFRLKYLAAYIQYYLLQNEIKGLFEILQLERRNKVPIEWQFFIYKVKIEIEDYMDLVHKSRSNTSNKIDVKKVYLFAKRLQDFEIGVETISDKCLDFWKELLKKADFDANNLHKVGTEITLMNIEIFNLVNNMFSINPNHGYLLRIYALFLQKVMNNDEDSDKYFKKFLNAQKTFQSYEAATLQEELVKNFSSNIRYVIVVMRVSTQESGIVEDINHEVRNLLGFRRNEVINKNISMLMPKCVGNLHDQFVQNYLDTAKPKILNKQREVFALKKNGYIIQVFIYATSVPMIEKDGIKFVGFLKKVDEKKHTDLLPPPVEHQLKKSLQIIAAPNGNIYGLNEQCFKMLGFPRYFTEDSDDKASDYNISNIIKNYNSTLYDCFKRSPSGVIQIIDTESLRQFIVPDMHSKNDIQHIRKCFGKYKAYIQSQPYDFGFKGGAYLPMIFFRIYLLEKIIFEESYEGKESHYKSMILSKKKTESSFRIQSRRWDMDDDQDQIKKNLARTAINARIKMALGGQIRPDEVVLEEEDDDISDEVTPQALKGHHAPILGDQEINIHHNKQIQEFLESSASSMSASLEGKSTDIARLREFRKMVNSRKEPSTVIFIRRFVIFVTAIILAIVSVNVGFKLNFYKQFQNITEMGLVLNDISMELFEINSGFRTLINIHNNIQQNELLGYIENGKLQTKINDRLRKFLTDLNDNKNKFLQNIDYFEDELDTENPNIEIKNIQSDGNTEKQSVNINLALGQIISKGNNLIESQSNNRRSFQNRTFIEYINKVKKNATANFTNRFGRYGNEIDQITKDLYFIQENIFQTLTDKCESLLFKIEELKDEYIVQQMILFLILISLILAITIISISLIFYIVRQIHKTRIQSLSLYAELNLEDVQHIIKDLGVFMKIIKEGSEDINKKIHQNMNESSDEECEQFEFQDAYDQQPDHNHDSEISKYDDSMVLKKNKSFGVKTKLDGLRSVQDMQLLMNKTVSEDLHESPSRDDIEIEEIPKRDQRRLSVLKKQETLRPKNSGYQNNSFTNSMISANLDNDTSRINDPDMSQRELNPQDLKKKPRKTDVNNIIPADQQQEQNDEYNQKVGNLDKFKMVRSNSNLRVISIVIALFSFVIIFVISNYAVFVPMFQNFQNVHFQEGLILSQQRSYYKIYTQVLKDLANGKIEYSYKDTYKSNYQVYQQQKFDELNKLEQILNSHASYLSDTINLVRQLNTKDFCDKLRDNLDAEMMFNYTYCENVDQKIAFHQGFRIQAERILGEIASIRMAFEQKPVDYNKYYSLFDKEQTLTKFQIMMENIITPSYYVVKKSIEDNFLYQIQINTNVDISILTVFIVAQLLILMVAWPRFLKNMNNQISKSRGILTLIPSRLIISNNNIKKIIEQNKLLTQ